MDIVAITVNSGYLQELIYALLYANKRNYTEYG